LLGICFLRGALECALEGIGEGRKGVDSAPGSRWILKRSPDLSTDSFTETYRYDGLNTDTAAPGITYIRNAAGFTITDTTPPPGSGFYRFEAALEP
jgi:hypothetical protein